MTISKIKDEFKQALDDAMDTRINFVDSLKKAQDERMQLILDSFNKAQDKRLELGIREEKLFNAKIIDKAISFWNTDVAHKEGLPADFVWDVASHLLYRIRDAVEKGEELSLPDIKKYCLQTNNGAEKEAPLANQEQDINYYFLIKQIAKLMSMAGPEYGEWTAEQIVYGLKKILPYLSQSTVEKALMIMLDKALVGVSPDNTFSLASNALEDLNIRLSPIDAELATIIYNNPVDRDENKFFSSFVDRVYEIIESNKKRGWTPMDIAEILSREGDSLDTYDETIALIEDAFGVLVEAEQLEFIPPGEPWPKENRWRFVP